MLLHFVYDAGLNCTHGQVTRGILTDCLLNYKTVKYFSGEEYEALRYAEAIGEYQTLERRVVLSLNLLNFVQTLIITSGLLVGSLIVVSCITRDSNTSDFVVFITYCVQLYFPLSNLGSVYRTINPSLVDNEKLLHLLNEPTEVVDGPDAKDLVVLNGKVEFDNVSFSYDDQTSVLHNISFKVPHGRRVALVGKSGAGKSTILRFLYCFYDLKPDAQPKTVESREPHTNEPSKATSEESTSNESGDRTTVMMQECKPLQIPDGIHVHIMLGNLKDYVGLPVYHKDRMYVALPPPGVNQCCLGYLGNGLDANYVDDLLQSMPGKGGLQLTGKLGEVIRESVQIGLSWVKAHAYELGITKMPNKQFLMDLMIMGRTSQRLYTCQRIMYSNQWKDASTPKTRMAIIEWFYNRTRPKNVPTVTASPVKADHTAEDTDGVDNPGIVGQLLQDALLQAALQNNALPKAVLQKAVLPNDAPPKAALRNDALPPVKAALQNDALPCESYKSFRVDLYQIVHANANV
ncbi:hypothetical protein DFH29DRAFT_1014204 [Suillus ampliporus]|nr:hypothetical protein DFH29DRAFT_1014204 [Suillus ampliporus]